MLQSQLARLMVRCCPSCQIIYVWMFFFRIFCGSEDAWFDVVDSISCWEPALSFGKVSAMLHEETWCNQTDRLWLEVTWKLLSFSHFSPSQANKNDKVTPCNSISLTSHGFGQITSGGGLGG